MKIIESFSSFVNLKNLKKWAFNKIKKYHEGVFHNNLYDHTVS